jgi:ribonuclease Z
VIVHASDREHGHVELDRVLIEYAQNADVLIYDAQYTPEEYEQRRGWGHSTWLEATRVAKEAGVKQLVLFHHDPAHNDEFITHITEDARAEFKNVEAAREGWTIHV